MLVSRVSCVWTGRTVWTVWTGREETQCIVVLRANGENVRGGGRELGSLRVGAKRVRLRTAGLFRVKVVCAFRVHTGGISANLLRKLK